MGKFPVSLKARILWGETIATTEPPNLHRLDWPPDAFPFPGQSHRADHPGQCQALSCPPRQILPGPSREDPEVRHRPPARYPILACCTHRHGSSSPRKQPHCRGEETSLAQRENRVAVPRMFWPHHSPPLGTPYGYTDPSGLAFIPKYPLSWAFRSRK